MDTMSVEGRLCCPSIDREGVQGCLDSGHGVGESHHRFLVYNTGYTDCISALVKIAKARRNKEFAMITGADA